MCGLGNAVVMVKFPCGAKDLLPVVDDKLFVYVIEKFRTVVHQGDIVAVVGFELRQPCAADDILLFDVGGDRIDVSRVRGKPALHHIVLGYEQVAECHDDQDERGDAAV